MGIRVLPPDVNSSDWSFTPDGEAIRFGLGAIKSIGQSAVESIIAARREAGPFTSMYDFCERVDLSAVNRRMIESLIKAGALDSLAPIRSQLFAAVEGAMESGQKAWRDRQSGQGGLFGEVLEEQPQERPLPQVPEWPDQQKLTGEKEVLGFYVTGHPLEQYRDKVAELATHASDTLEGLERGVEVSMCGILTSIQRRRNKEGKVWASMQLEDLNGSIEAVLFTTNYDRLAQQLVEDQAVLVKGLVLPDESGPPKVSIQDIIPLEIAGVLYPSLVSIRVPLARQNDAAADLNELFARKPGQTSVRLRLESPRDFTLTLDISTKVKPDREFIREVERICGPDSYEKLAG
jgi:DNA polymerase-3 subunit alpha